MKHRFIIGILLLSLFGACTQEVVSVEDEDELEDESIMEDETKEESESVVENETEEESESIESNTTEDTQTKTSKQKRHSAIESESTLISAYDLYENEEI